MTIDDNLIIDPGEAPQLATAEQASNYIQERIEEVRNLIKNEPAPPTNRLDALEYIKWERRLLILHGQATGALQALQAFNHISIPQFKVLKNMIIGTMLRRTAGVQLGVDGL